MNYDDLPVPSFMNWYHEEVNRVDIFISAKSFTQLDHPPKFLTRECEAMNELLEVHDVGVKCPNPLS